MELAELQDQEVGDGTTSVVIVAAELLKRANELVRNRIHPTSIIGGYRIAMREVSLPHKLCLETVLFSSDYTSSHLRPCGSTQEKEWDARLLLSFCEAASPVSQACRYIEEHLSIDTASLGKETLLNAAKTAMSSKIVDSESDFFAHMVVDAVQVGFFMQIDMIDALSSLIISD